MISGILCTKLYWLSGCMGLLMEKCKSSCYKRAHAHALDCELSRAKGVRPDCVSVQVPKLGGITGPAVWAVLSGVQSQCKYCLMV